MQFELNAKNLEKNGFRHIPASRERVGKPMVYYKKDGSNVFVVIFDSVYTVWSVPVKHLEKLKSYKQLHFAVNFIQSFDIQSKIDVVNNQISLVIPPVITTDTKSESCVIADSVGVVDSVGDSLSHEFEQILSCCDTCLDLPSFMRCKDACSLSKDEPHVSPVGLGV